jgi:hypothetical protein
VVWIQSDPTSSVPYRLLFDLAQAGFRTWWAFVPFFAVGALLVQVGVVMKRPRFAWFGAASGVLLGCIAEIATFREYRRLQSALRAGAFEVVEGVVTDFTPRGRDGHPPESWHVASRRYKLEPAAISNGFDKAGVVHPGQRVRIADVDGHIVRLEVAP